MKNVFKWVLFILIATAAMAAGMYCLAQCLDADKPLSSDKEAQSESGKPQAFNYSHRRRYTKLNLS